jgi:serine/threonine-protein kinase RsbT
VFDEVIFPISSDLDIVAARQNARTMAAKLGFAPIDQTLIATAISELARNIVRYAQHGEILLKMIEGKNSSPGGLMVVARDEGPGILNTQQALEDGYSTSGSLGLGLPGAKRLMDEFEISSAVGKGTTVTVTKWLKSL